jgi:hypothetical protein
MKQDEMDQVGQEVAKKKWKDRGSPVIGDNGLMTEAGDNQRYMAVGLQLYQMEKVDLNNPQEVKDRIAEYFRLYAEADMKPTVTGLGMALGVDRRRLWEIASGNYRDKTQAALPFETQDAIKKAYDFLGNLWENYMQNGKINPVSGIFLGKNNFGYQDKQDVVITPNNPESDYSAQDIASRYTLPETTSDSE